MVYSSRNGETCQAHPFQNNILRLIQINSPIYRGVILNSLNPGNPLIDKKNPCFLPYVYFFHLFHDLFITNLELNINKTSHICQIKLFVYINIPLTNSNKKELSASNFY